jgi:signal transduction histidine kinase
VSTVRWRSIVDLLRGDIAEVGRPAYRAKLWFGIRSGFSIVLVLALFAGYAHVTGVMPITPLIVGLIGLKLVANTIAWLALRRGVLELPTAGANLLADIVAMTGAIYATGGVLSPLLPIYAIELTVMALLTNVGVTLLTGIATFASYAAMLALVRAGALPATRPAVALPGEVDDAYLVVALVFTGFVIAVPTGFAAAILRRLRGQEAALRAQAEQLVEAARQKSQFMANVTHELRTPIHGICGLADLVEAGVYGPVTDAQRAAAIDIKGSATSLLRLIDDLLLLARDDAGRLEYRPTAVDLREVLDSVMATVAFLRGTRSLHVSLDAREPLPPMHTDRGKLVQILVNLLANAVKFTPDGGHVVLRARALDPDHVELAVIDDGIGIPERELGRIFEAFRQVDGSTERVYGGTGLGLALVKKLCALLGGEIRVESTIGRGSIFVATLPCRGPERAPSVPGLPRRDRPAPTP